MIRGRFAGSPDLTLAVYVSLAAIVAALAPVPGVVRAVVVLPALLFATGYAIAIALFPSRQLPGETLLVLSVTFSTSALVLGIVATEVVAPMSRPGLALLVAAITVGAALIAQRRRQRPLNGPPVSPPPRPRWPSALAAATFLVAIGLSCWAVALASDGAKDQLHESHFTSLWLVRGDGGATVGVENHEGEGVGYSLLVRQGKAVVGRWRLRLGRGDAWTRSLPAEPGAGGALVADLFREGSSYRTVTLLPGGTS